MSESPHHDSVEMWASCACTRKPCARHDTPSLLPPPRTNSRLCHLRNNVGHVDCIPCVFRRFLTALHEYVDIKHRERGALYDMAASIF
jgi:hypothetical protein